MQEKLLVHLSNLPEEGKTFSGQLDPAFFDLPEKDAKTTTPGPLSYNLHTQRFDNELLLQGQLSAPFDLTCVRTLHSFRHTITLDHAAVAAEITSGEIDVTDLLREEILIHFPTYPNCQDHADQPDNYVDTCQIDEKYLAPEGEESDDAPKPDNRWDALDQLKSDS